MVSACGKCVAITRATKRLLPALFNYPLSLSKAYSETIALLMPMKAISFV
jgi:hypothetical protein